MTATTMVNPTKTLLTTYQQRINDLLLCQLDELQSIPTTLLKPLRYTIAHGGKRLRPCLVYLTGKTFGAASSHCDAAAMAVEHIHTYSLIHDDLPAMDDDDLRHGQPSCHIAYDEARAILAGDGLQSLAFETLALDSPWHSATQQLQMILTLSQAIGPAGMVGGQALDMAAEQQAIDLEQLKSIHRLKTGALLKASILLGAQCAHVDDQTHINALNTYGHHLGIAFQIHDDILDVTQDNETLGKPSHSDIASNKSTYVSCLGLADATQQRDQHLQNACEALSALPFDTDDLTALAHYLVERNY